MINRSSSCCHERPKIDKHNFVLLNVPKLENLIIGIDQQHTGRSYQTVPNKNL